MNPRRRCSSRSNCISKGVDVAKWPERYAPNLSQCGGRFGKNRCLVLAIGTTMRRILAPTPTWAWHRTLGTLGRFGSHAFGLQWPPYRRLEAPKVTGQTSGCVAVTDYIHQVSRESITMLHHSLYLTRTRTRTRTKPGKEIKKCSVTVELLGSRRPRAFQSSCSAVSYSFWLLALHWLSTAHYISLPVTYWLSTPKRQSPTESHATAPSPRGGAQWGRDVHFQCSKNFLPTGNNTSF